MTIRRSDQVTYYMNPFWRDYTDCLVGHFLPFLVGCLIVAIFQAASRGLATALGITAFTVLVVYPLIGLAITGVGRRLKRRRLEREGYHIEVRP